jgi:hypothetical protein
VQTPFRSDGIFTADEDGGSKCPRLFCQVNREIGTPIGALSGLEAWRPQWGVANASRSTAVRLREMIGDRYDLQALCLAAYAVKAVCPSTSSVMIVNFVSLCGPKDVIIGISAASRPRAIKMRPIRALRRAHGTAGALRKFRQICASEVHCCSSLRERLTRKLEKLR